MRPRNNPYLVNSKSEALISKFCREHGEDKSFIINQENIRWINKKSPKEIGAILNYISERLTAFPKIKNFRSLFASLLKEALETDPELLSADMEDKIGETLSTKLRELVEKMEKRTKPIKCHLDAGHIQQIVKLREIYSDDQILSALDKLQENIEKVSGIKNPASWLMTGLSQIHIPKRRTKTIESFTQPLSSLSVNTPSDIPSPIEKKENETEGSSAQAIQTTSKTYSSEQSTPSPALFDPTSPLSNIQKDFFSEIAFTPIRSKQSPPSTEKSFEFSEEESLSPLNLPLVSMINEFRESFYRLFDSELLKLESKIEDYYQKHTSDLKKALEIEQGKNTCISCGQNPRDILTL